MEDDDKYDYIPGSLRPDGTRRAPIKVKKGYVPPDEIKKFETKGTKFRDSQIPGFVPGMDPADMPGKKEAPKSKNQKRNENRKKRNEEGGGDDDEGDEGAGAAMAAVKLADPAPAAAAADPADPKEVLNKKIRNLKKKVRQSDELQEKVKSKEVEPNDEQRDKLAKRGELESEIAALEKELAAM
mmetsp:Transcript_12931/g.25583  ORF Transcript_12931/g.25583 Transcript_12931/m.25583 type:complete len:184 (+) Transcript_12931:126-677(+)